MNFFNKIFTDYGLNNNTAIKYLSIVALSIVILLICLLAYGIGKMITSKIIPRYIKRSKNKFDDILLSNKFYSRLSHALPIIIVYLVEPYMGIQRNSREDSSCLLNYSSGLLLVSLLDSIDELYKMYEISKTKPITAILQVVKSNSIYCDWNYIYLNLMGENPLALLGGLGALSAVFH